MLSLKIEQRESVGKNIAEAIVENIKIYLVIKPLQKLFGANFYADKLEYMRNLPADSIGHEYAKMLDQNDLKVIPQFAEHDLKHLILGYGMTSAEELKMQAYLLGNGNYSPICIGFLSFGILFPSLWEEFYAEFKKGKAAPSIFNLSLKDCMEKKSSELKRHFRETQRDPITSQS
ncbi:MAG: hypothetical protein AB8H47_00380 [Bacteroidia bacterium]